MILYSPKTIDLGDGTYLHFWYANNKGNGKTNVSMLVIDNPNRYDARCIVQRRHRIKTAGWSGLVNFSRKTAKDLGINYSSLYLRAIKMGILRKKRIQK